MLIISSIWVANLAYSQFYYYSGNLRGSRARGIVKDVYRINLKTGIREEILTGVECPIVLPEINKVVFKSNPQLDLCIYDGKKERVDTLSHIGKIEEVIAAHTVPPDSHIFLGLVKLHAKIIDKELMEFESTEILIDKDSYAILDTTCWYYMNWESVISRDGKRIYTLVDSINGIFFRTEDTETGVVIDEKSPIVGYENLQIKDYPYFIGAGNGYVFVGYLSKDGEDGHSVLCDPENKGAIHHFVMPVGPPYEEGLTPKGDMIFQDGGNIYILDRGTAQLKQRFKFKLSDNPDIESKIFILGDNLYFFPEDPEKSERESFPDIGRGDLSQEQSTSSLLGMLIEDVDEAYQKGWIKNRGIYTSLSKKLENAKKHLDQGEAKPAGNLLNAFFNEVEAQREKHLTKEASSVLRFNAECLMKRLTE